MSKKNPTEINTILNDMFATELPINSTPYTTSTDDWKKKI